MSVVSQIRFINELPERLKVMTIRLNEDYTCLKVVYDEWIGYYSWMQKLKTQISAMSSPEMQVSPFVPSLIPAICGRNLRRLLRKHPRTPPAPGRQALGAHLSLPAAGPIRSCRVGARFDDHREEPASSSASQRRISRRALRRSCTITEKKWCRGSWRIAIGWRNARIGSWLQSSVVASTRLTFFCSVCVRDSKENR